MTEEDVKVIREVFRHELGIFAEDVQHRFVVLAEGQQMLGERMDRIESELKTEIVRADRRVTVVHAELSQKLDAVAADLAAHRRDTEAHSVYRVGE